MKGLLWILVALAVLAGGAFVAVGGREGVLITLVKLTQRKDPLPNQPVAWQPGPSAVPAAGAKRPPNVILIVADDLGYNDLTFNGGGVAGGAVPTPRIDSIARDGVNFSHGYAGNATCSPSRAALLTGRYPTRFGFEYTPIPLQFSKLVGGHDASGSPFRTMYHAEREAEVPDVAAMGMPTSELTMATLMKKAGYRTLHLGKWHLGEERRFQPNAHGFDESLSIMGGGGMFLHQDDPNVINAKIDFDPIVMRWPAAIPAGTTFRAPVSHFDIFATALAAAGIALPTDRKIDGVDLQPYISGRSAGRPHDVLFWRSGPYRAVQSGDWKLQVSETPRKDWLYDLAADPTEKNNLAAAQPAKVQELKALLAAFDKEQVKPVWPSMTEIPVGIDRPLNQPPQAGDDLVYWPI